MRNNNSTTYALDNDTGEFKKGDIELTVIRVNGEHIGENPMEAERKNRILPQIKPYTLTASLLKNNRKENHCLLENVSSNPFLYPCRWSLLCLNSIKWG